MGDHSTFFEKLISASLAYLHIALFVVERLIDGGVEADLAHPDCQIFIIPNLPLRPPPDWVAQWAHYVLALQVRLELTAGTILARAVLTLIHEPVAHRALFTLAVSIKARSCRLISR